LSSSQNFFVVRLLLRIVGTTQAANFHFTISTSTILLYSVFYAIKFSIFEDR